MHLDFLFNVFRENQEREAVIWKDRTFTYRWLLEQVEEWCRTLDTKGVASGSAVALEGDFSPNTLALFLALAKKSMILVPLVATLDSAKKAEYYKIAQPDFIFKIDEAEGVVCEPAVSEEVPRLYQKLKEQGHPGLVLFSSGTSGKPKAILHDFLRLAKEPEVKRPSAKMLQFLLFDHMGGVDTLLTTLSNGWTAVMVQDRSPDAVCRLIECHRVEVLPVSPTFLGLLLFSGAHERYDLNSLKIITYGAEPMPESMLRKLASVFPGVRLRQTYGLSEFGTFKVKSKSSDSLWVKIEGEGTSYRIIDGILHTRASLSMLGYLGAPDPFTQDGWFNTGDVVEVDGEYIKILGRESDLLNIGGLKFYPIEVESVIQEIKEVMSVTVYSEKNSLFGNILCASLRIDPAENQTETLKAIKRHCHEKLEPHKVPAKFVLQNQDSLHGARFKKARVVDR